MPPPFTQQERNLATKPLLHHHHPRSRHPFVPFLKNSEQYFPSHLLYLSISLYIYISTYIYIYIYIYFIFVAKIMIKIRSWLSICSSSSTCISTTDDIHTIPPPLPPETSIIHQHSTTTSNSSSSPSTSQEYYSTNSSSLDSNLSLLTLPSIPSLQNNNLSSNYSLIATSSSSSSLITSLKQQPPPPRHHHHPHVIINFLAVHENLLYAVSGNQILVFRIFVSFTNFTPFDTFGVQDSSVKSLTFCKGKIFSAHQDSKIRVWKLINNKNHKLISTLPTLQDRLSNVMLPKNYVSIRRHRKKLWVEHYDAVSALAVSEKNLTVYSVSWDKYLKIWKAPNFRCLESIKAHDDAINALAVSSDGLVYTGSADKRIKVWGIRQVGEGGKKKRHVLIATLEKHKSAVNALALSSDGKVLFSGSCDRSILVWEKEDSANHMVVVGALRGHTKAVLCLTMIKDVVVNGGSGGGYDDDDDFLLFSGSADGTVRVWNRKVVDGRYCCLTVLDDRCNGNSKPVKSLEAVPAEKGECGGEVITVISGSFDGEIKVWKVTVSSPIKKS